MNYSINLLMLMQCIWRMQLVVAVNVVKIFQSRVVFVYTLMGDCNINELNAEHWVEEGKN